MFSRRKGRYAVRLANRPEDLSAAQRLRYLAFVSGSKATPRPHAQDPHAQDDTQDNTHDDGHDSDAFDALCDHVLVEDARSGQLVCTLRLLPLRGGAEIAGSYSAQYYGLEALYDYPGAMVEMGRFCIHPEWHDPDILRIAWGAVATYVEARKIDLLFGCSSFHGTDTGQYADAFAMLKARHLAPKRFLPRVKAPQVFPFAARLRRKPDAKKAMRKMPPLLRSYLMLGGWVSDHAVVDRELNTLHVFTGLEIRTITPARQKLLRAVMT